MQKMWPIYHSDIPLFIQEFASTPLMQRLKDVGMNCGCEYTNLKIFNEKESYTRYDHSVGVALIIYHFTNDIKMSIAGLLHDISTPIFAHVIDFMNKDYINQESTEDDTKKMIDESKEIQDLLHKYHLCSEDVCDYHLYSIADNKSPQLSADRLEYTLGNLYNYGFCSLEQLQRFYNHLVIGINEFKQEEIMFDDFNVAEEFNDLAFKTFHIYIADADRFSMQTLADLIQYCINHHILTYDDLYTTESNVINKIKNNNESNKLWKRYVNYKQVIVSKEYQKDWIYVHVKKRYIDAYVEHIGRLSLVSSILKQRIKELNDVDFDVYINAI